MPTSRPASKLPPPSIPRVLDLYTSRVDSDRAERRRLRWAISAAAMVHAALLVATFPELTARTPDVEKKERPVFVVQHPPYTPPPPQRTEIPVQRARRVPIPDPTPDDPEPIVIGTLPEIDQNVLDPDAISFAIPDAPPEPEPDGPIRVGGEVAPPARLHTIDPRYTDMARKARVQGTVIVQATINKNGHVAHVEVLKGLPMGLDAEAVKAVEQWRFEPATLNGRPVAVLYTLTVRFQLH